MRAHEQTNGRGRGERGQATVELALLLPLLLLIVLGMVDFGKAFNYWIDETHLAGTAARWAVVNKLPGSLPAACTALPTDQQLACAIAQQGSTGELVNGGTGTQVPTSGKLAITFCTPSGSTAGQVGQPVKAKAAATYNVLGFLRVLGIRASIPLHASATMRLEQPNPPVNGNPSYYQAPVSVTC